MEPRGDVSSILHLIELKRSVAEFLSCHQDQLVAAIVAAGFFFICGLWAAGGLRESHEQAGCIPEGTYRADKAAG